MNTRFLTALKKYLENQHIASGGISLVPGRVCQVCWGRNEMHAPDCPLGNLLTEIDNVLVQAVRKDLT